MFRRYTSSLYLPTRFDSDAVSVLILGVQPHQVSRDTFIGRQAKLLAASRFLANQYNIPHKCLPPAPTYLETTSSWVEEIQGSVTMLHATSLRRTNPTSYSHACGYRLGKSNYRCEDSTSLQAFSMTRFKHKETASSGENCHRS